MEYLGLKSNDLIPILCLSQIKKYRAAEYVLAQYDAGITRSMSRKGNCCDNAAMKPFFARLKVEEVYAQKYQNLEEAYSSVFEYIELFYNRVRRHSTNGYISPVEYENNYHESVA